jgi:hypothetical protein
MPDFLDYMLMIGGIFINRVRVRKKNVVLSIL